MHSWTMIVKDVSIESQYRAANMAALSREYIDTNNLVRAKLYQKLSYDEYANARALYISYEKLSNLESETQ